MPAVYLDSGGSDCDQGACYCCPVPKACAECREPDALVDPRESMCVDCRRRCLAECGCSATHFEIETFRELELEAVWPLDDAGRVKLEVRHCGGCSELLGVRIDRDGQPIPAALS